MAMTKPLSKVLDLETYTNQDRVRFIVESGNGDVEPISDAVEIPISIVHRLYHLGRAFDAQVVKLIDPTASFRLDFFKLQSLVSELELVLKIVNDPVTQHYLGMLLPELKKGIKHPGCLLNVSS
ncbi:MAG: hypothetical protein R3F41_17020 [Gammaproteobacteria bacterium]|nr:hypothetical protein [Pseudomonadales bacterium]MCP5347675.1 hypothetical protein [Pseudomonadales bacterium]